MASKSDYKEKLDCWSKYKNGDTVHKIHATQMIRYMFEISIGILKYLNKIQYIAVDLLTDEDYKKLIGTAEEKAKDITDQIF